MRNEQISIESVNLTQSVAPHTHSTRTVEAEHLRRRRIETDAATAASVAAASVPSAALVLMMIVLSAIDAPVQDVSLLWAIDWFV